MSDLRAGLRYFGTVVETNPSLPQAKQKEVGALRKRVKKREEGGRRPSRGQLAMGRGQIEGAQFNLLVVTRGEPVHAADIG